jgi:GT2 family glycosyltransferase
MRALSSALRAAACGAILVLASRRALTLTAALLPRRHRVVRLDPAPSVTVVVPIFNEEGSVPALLAALDRFDYPPDCLSVILVDDGSVDGSSTLIRTWAATRPAATAIRLRERQGKGAALNAIRADVQSELTILCDADLRPRPDLIRALAQRFADPRVGAVSAYLSPDPGRSTIAAGYASIESWVHQLVTCVGKDRLRLDPPVHGCAAYRTAALESIGWFSVSSPGEDVRVSMALSRCGWRTRFAEDAVADNRIVTSWRGYWRQHVRWARNLLRAHRAPRASEPGPDRDARPWRLVRGVERQLTSGGYADRLLLAAAIGLAIRRRIPRWLGGLYPAIIASELSAAVIRAGRGRQLPRYLLIAAAGAAIDLFASAAAILAQLLGKPHRWPPGQPHRPTRSPHQGPARQ